jgi:predicted nucleic acid-binding protein
MGLIIVDTNIVIYTIKGLKLVEPYIEEYEFSISEITIIELLGVKGIDDFTLTKRKEFINSCSLFPFNSFIREMAITLKQKYTLKVPDAIIAATSLHYDITLLTADKEFNKIKELTSIIVSV